LPEFNPIEEAFSKVKTILRKAKARTLKALLEATAQALGAVSADDARGYFGYCGYRTPQDHSYQVRLNSLGYLMPPPATSGSGCRSG
jgi:hypothetical protein